MKFRQNKFRIIWNIRDFFWKVGKKSDSKLEISEFFCQKHPLGEAFFSKGFPYKTNPASLARAVPSKKRKKKKNTKIEKKRKGKKRKKKKKERKKGEIFYKKASLARAVLLTTTPLT